MLNLDAHSQLIVDTPEYDRRFIARSLPRCFTILQTGNISNTGIKHGWTLMSEHEMDRLVEWWLIKKREK